MNNLKNYIVYKQYEIEGDNPKKHIQVRINRYSVNMFFRSFLFSMIFYFCIIYIWETTPTLSWGCFFFFLDSQICLDLLTCISINRRSDPIQGRLSMTDLENSKEIRFLRLNFNNRIAINFVGSKSTN